MKEDYKIYMILIIRMLLISDQHHRRLCRQANSKMIYNQMFDIELVNKKDAVKY